MTFVSTGADVSQRLEDLVAEFNESSARKYREAGLGGRAEVRYSPAWPEKPSWALFTPDSEFLQRWQIVYFEADGDLSYRGSIIGHTKVQAIRFLQQQRRAFP